MERLTFEENIGLSIDKGNDCPSCYVCWACDARISECPYFEDAIKKLKQYEDMEEQGKLIIPPCSQGDTVYIAKKVYHSKEITENEVVMARVTGICSVRNLEGEIIWCIRVFEKHGEYLLPFGAVGKTVFLTEQEAQEALQKMKGE